VQVEWGYPTSAADMAGDLTHLLQEAS